ncbi:MAG: hypothetical protein M3277_08830 [Actinomycetota bacterium]|nr:hypothetical protein [Actinomycetota bacterium]
MLGRALDAAFRNLATLFCVCAVIFVPLNLAHAFVFRNVLAVSELAPDIEAFPEGRKVRNVGSAELRDERTTGIVLLIVEAGLLVLVVGAARRSIDVEDGGGVATVPDSFANALSNLRGEAPDPRVVLGGVIVGAVSGWLTLTIGYRLAEILGSDAAYLGIGLSRGVAASLAGALIAGTAAASRRMAKPPPEKLDLY